MPFLLNSLTRFVSCIISNFATSRRSMMLMYIPGVSHVIKHVCHVLLVKIKYLQKRTKKLPNPSRCQMAVSQVSQESLNQTPVSQESLNQIWVSQESLNQTWVSQESLNQTQWDYSLLHHGHSLLNQGHILLNHHHIHVHCLPVLMDTLKVDLHPLGHALHSQVPKSHRINQF